MYDAKQVGEMRRSRRYPRWTDPDYMGTSRLLENLAAVLVRVNEPVRALDIFCGSRPYDDLLPGRSVCTGLDMVPDYGVADVVSSEFLPFDSDTFDLVLCIEGLYYLEDLAHGVAEIRRVLRPGGRVIVSAPGVWEYDRTGFEHRFTGPSLQRLFDGDWQDIEVRESGGYACSWGVITGRIVNLTEARLAMPGKLGQTFRTLLKAVYLLINFVALTADRVESARRGAHIALPPNLLLTALKPEITLGDEGARDVPKTGPARVRGERTGE